MLKWFAAPNNKASTSSNSKAKGRGDTKKGTQEVITDDPLATITLTLPRVGGRPRRNSSRGSGGGGGSSRASSGGVRPREIYAVSRVNPIFEDDEAAGNSPDSGSSPEPGRRPQLAPESPGKSASSGYESNPTDRTSSSEFSDDVSGASPGSQRGYLGEAVTSVVHQTAGRTINNAQAAAPTVARRSPRGSRRRAGGGGGTAPNTTNHLTEAMTSVVSSVALATIPEGQVHKEPGVFPIGYCIPAPVWPQPINAGAAERLNGCEDGLAEAEEEAVLKGLSASLSHSRALAAVSRALLVHEPHELARALPQPPRPPDIALISDACGGNRRQRLRGIEAVRELWDKSGMKVNGSRRLLVESEDDDDSSDRSSSEPRLHCDLLASNSSSSTTISNNMPPAETIDPPPPPPPPPLPPQRCESSSSSSGYSELSITTSPSPSCEKPPSELLSSSPPSTLTPVLRIPLPPVFLHSDMSMVSNSVRNAMIYGTLCRIKCASGVSAVGASYEKLLGINKVFDAKLGASSVLNENPKAVWNIFPETEVVKSPANTYDKTAHYYPPSQRPDFTLDMPGAERLLRKIAASKRQRCWGRFIISFLGLLFFLMSVMAVSMLYTRGRRLFGSL